MQHLAAILIIWTNQGWALLSRDQLSANPSSPAPGRAARGGGWWWGRPWSTPAATPAHTAGSRVTCYMSRGTTHRPVAVVVNLAHHVRQDLEHLVFKKIIWSKKEYLRLREYLFYSRGMCDLWQSEETRCEAGLRHERMGAQWWGDEGRGSAVSDNFFARNQQLSCQHCQHRVSACTMFQVNYWPAWAPGSPSRCTRPRSSSGRWWSPSPPGPGTRSCPCRTSGTWLKHDNTWRDRLGPQ